MTPSEYTFILSPSASLSPPVFSLASLVILGWLSIWDGDAADLQIPEKLESEPLGEVGGVRTSCVFEGGVFIRTTCGPRKPTSQYAEFLDRRAYSTESINGWPI